MLKFKNQIPENLGLILKIYISSLAGEQINKGGVLLIMTQIIFVQTLILQFNDKGYDYDGNIGIFVDEFRKID